MQTQLASFPILQMLNAAPPIGRFKPYSLSELSSHAGPSWLVEDVLPVHTLATMYGRSSEGKTFAALDMALCAATGIPWHGHPTKQCQVVYVASEGVSGIRTRAEAWEKHHQHQAGQFFVVKEAVQLLDKTQVNQLIQAITAGGLTPGLLVIDTFARSFSGDENSAQEVGSAIDALDRIRKTLDCAVMIVHHSGKAHGVRAQERGSSALRGAMDVMIHVQKSKSKNFVQITSDKQKEADDFPTIGVHLTVVPLSADAMGTPRSSCVLTDAPPLAIATPQLTRSQQAALTALAKLPAGPVKAATWRTAISPLVSKRTFYEAARCLAEAGLVRRPNSGSYELKPHAAASATALQSNADCTATATATAAITPTPVGGGVIQQQALEPELVPSE